MSVLKQFFTKIRRPFQVMVMESTESKTIRHFNISIAHILMILFGLILVSSILTWLLIPNPTSSLSSRYYQLQQSSHDLNAKLAETEGELSLSTAQIDALKTELKKEGKHADTLMQRVRSYESILNAQKSGGIRMLRAEAYWNGAALLTYDIVIVKSGNFPRYVSGSVRIIARNSKGRKATLHLGKNVPELHYHMKTHTFLHGSYAWKHDWRPDHLVIIHLNHKGEVRERTKIKIQEGIM